MEALAAEQTDVRFGKVNVDVAPDLSSRLGADQVPFVAFLDPRGQQVDKLAGADPPRLVAKVKALATRPFQAPAAAPSGGEGGAAGEEDLNARLKALINFSPVMVFMKGSKDSPFCKFSKQLVAILNKHEIEYSTFNILEDEEVRQGLKEYSNWKTYPQLYLSGELIGGVDIVKEMDEDGSLLEAIPKDAKGEQSLEDRLKSLINKAPVMLFMKGNRETPRCGFSGKIVNILNENSVKFETFDILEDEEVRQGLKEYSSWPTFPQLYAKGRLIGGLDIVKELADEGELLNEMGTSGS